LVAGDEQAKRSGGAIRWAAFDREIIILCVRWYLRYKLSLRDLVEMMAERGFSLAHATIMRWVKGSSTFPFPGSAMPLRRPSKMLSC
jgi:transposase-like protein